MEFCVGFKEMERRLKPLRVIIVGRIPEELETDTEIINFEGREWEQRLTITRERKNFQSHK